MKIVVGKVKPVGYRVDTGVVAIATDGVILDYNGGIERVGREVLGAEMRVREPYFAMERRYGLSAWQRQAIMGAMYVNESGFGYLEPLAGSVDAVRALRRMGYRVHLLFEANPGREGLAVENMRRLGLKADGVHIISSRKDRHKTLASLRPAVFIDTKADCLFEAPFVPDRVLIERGYLDTGTLDERLYVANGLCGWLTSWGGTRAMMAMLLAGGDGDNVVPMQARPLLLAGCGM